MNWAHEVVENMRMLKAAGYEFSESWQVTLELFPHRLTYGKPVQVRLFGDDALEQSVVEFAHDRCLEAWRGERPELVEQARQLVEVFGFDSQLPARGRTRVAAT